MMLWGTRNARPAVDTLAALVSFTIQVNFQSLLMKPYRLLASAPVCAMVGFLAVMVPR